MRSPRITGLLENNTDDTDRLWAELTAAGTPLMEPWGHGRTLVTFLWRGEADRVRAWWNIDVPLTRLPGTDIWHGSEVFPSDLRTIYGLVLGDTEDLPARPDDRGPAQLDRDNPRSVFFEADPDDPTDASSWASVLQLPEAPRSPWTRPHPGIPAGALTTAWFRPDVPVTAYFPYGIEPDDLPILVVFDGYLGQTLMRIPTVLDNLIAEGRIHPTAALFVRGRDETRLRDLTPGPHVGAFADELLPWARTRWGIGSPTGDNVAAGQSRGGLVAAHLGLTRPHLFTGVIAQSGSFWWPAPPEGVPRQLIRDAARQAVPRVRYFLDVGRMETMPGPDNAPSQLDTVREMRDALRSRDCDVTYLEYSGGHDYVNWRHNFPEALIAVTR
ncbi:DUF3327 domain-containing protein [Actinoplanes sp. LDG1-06]|uniref:DUF3327 domain-containing protein n=1 Tax=Paractinoplanes ovalisporus TaxID=2810368 RepID=A0ABS2AB51_9ACTN|nr:alpha/beta hydrolase-fold protein [Actinoplanes ovalisporus]MBM2616519.1 DUF3327 domain-containing protein [Actinoplanes ovalisporus]